MAKTVRPAKFTELKGLDRISQVVHEMHCIFRVISQDDFGIDGEIEVVTAKPDGPGFQTTGGIINVQAKSGESYVKKNNAASFSTPVRKEDLEYWNGCTFPVFFIVYHPQDDALYYKEIQSYITGTPEVFRAPLQVIFDKSVDLFSASAEEAVYKHSSISPPRISFKDQERLYSNLLPVDRLPITLTFATTERASHKEVKSEINGYAPPFCIYEKALYTVSDLRQDENVLRPFCDVTTICDMPFAAWLDDLELKRNLVFMMNQLLGSHCHRRGLRYNPGFKRTYFPRETTNDEDRAFERTWTSPRTGRSDTRTVVQYYEYGAFKFWRHLAAELAFVQFGEKWYLEVVPKYLFTDDGATPSNPSLVGPYTTSQKAKEHNPQVLNHVLFWGHTLAGGKQRIEMSLFGEPLIIVDPQPLAAIAEFALPLDPASYEEEPSSAQVQMSLFGWDPTEGQIDEY
jgi:hypothetical protein